ncbi:phage gp6-like head-tail connector protein [Rhizobium sp. P32RR-XVIII]|uniref:head-tail connector protein n=1 Tax=Rhizobium sp. P32RR-XVIII TaxID=2726738 RepID=UPI00145702FF|nr:head-tail connector protein [Rhizobium sp. P32RR-XVIII]NLS07613.1 phage gp6-like head-tail connector protein [Rhizobium sp. P32RR-XVIII]
MALVTVDQVNLALRLSLVDGDERIPDIELKISQAEDAVLDYLKKPDAGWDETTVPARVNAAVLLLVQSLLDEANTGGLLPGLGSGDPKSPVVALLYRLRDPAIA